MNIKILKVYLNSLLDLWKTDVEQSTRKDFHDGYVEGYSKALTRVKIFIGEKNQ